MREYVRAGRPEKRKSRFGDPGWGAPVEVVEAFSSALAAGFCHFRTGGNLGGKEGPERLIRVRIIRVSVILYSPANVGVL